MKTYTEFINEELSEASLDENVIGSYLKSPIKVKVNGVDFDLKFKKDKAGITASLENQHGKKVISRANPSNTDVNDFLSKMLSVYKIKIEKV